jgi:hypothetical protein
MPAPRLSTRNFFALLITLLAAGVLHGFLSDAGANGRSSDYRIEGEDRAPEAQRVAGRRFRPLAATERWTAAGDASPLLGTLRAKLGPGGDVYVADYGDRRVKRFSAAGEYLGAFGAGRGQGPGEFVTITDYLVTDDGEVWVADNGSGRITVFSPDATLRRTLRIAPHQPYRLLLRPDRRLLLMQPFSTGHLFAIVDEDGHEHASFGELISDQAANSILLDGLIEPTGGGGFVFAGHHASVVSSYASDGRLRWAVEPIVPSPLPPIVPGPGGIQWVDPDAPGITWSVSVSGDRLHLLGAHREAMRGEPVLDTYELASGRYLFSRRLPRETRWTAVAPGTLITATDTSVTSWDLVD